MTYNQIVEKHTSSITDEIKSKWGENYMWNPLNGMWRRKKGKSGNPHTDSALLNRRGSTPAL